jgi:hypothetical protein
MPESSPDGTPAGDKGPRSWALHIRVAARRTGCRVLQKVRVHEQGAQPRIEMPTMDAQLIIILVSDQFGESVQRTFPEG